MVTETKYVTCPDCGKLGYSENEAGGHCWECDDAEKDRLSAEIERLQAALTIERERCAQLVLARARLWNDHARTGHPGDCAESLADECEDIVAAIRRQ